MKKTVKRILLLIMVFLMVGLTAIVVTIYKNNGRESQSTLHAAEYPIIRLIYGEEYAHELHGYTEKMAPVTVRDSITPLSEERILPIEIETYGQTVGAVSYQIRSLDGSHLVEDTQVASFQQQNGVMTANLQISNLIEENTEYFLTIELDMNEHPVYYYSRIIYGKSMYTTELLHFVEEFSNATFDSKQAADFGIANYLQTDSSISASDFSYTNIHSTKSMVTWGDWKPQRVGEIKRKITELSDTQMSVLLTYSIQTPDDPIHIYDVEEFFCVRYRNDRVYLLDYERQVKQELSIDKESLENGSLRLGITKEDCQVIQVKGEKDKKIKQVAFAYDGEVWSYRPEMNQIKQLFSFEENGDEDIRNQYGEYDLQIVHATENGDVDFLVYGYMNRGDHEGSVGISFYRYIETEDMLEEKFFIPVAVSSQMLCSDLGELTYVNQNDMCYFLYGDSIYSVDLVSGECMEVTNRAKVGMYAKNKKGNLVAWQDGEDETFPDQIQVLNMDTGEIKSIQAQEGEYLKLNDFIENDLVYGIGKKEDVVMEAGMIVRYPMYALEIVDAQKQLNVETRYEVDGIYILEVQVTENQVSMKRAMKGTDGTYQETNDDMLLLNFKEGEEDTDFVTAKISDTKKREYYLNLGIENSETLSVRNQIPMIKQTNNQHRVDLPNVHENETGYYVFARGGLMSREGMLNEAISKAYDAMGVVVDSNQTYLWTRDTRDVYKTLTLGLQEAASNEESLAAVLSMVIQYEGGGSVDTERALYEQKSVYQILTESLPEKKVVDLQGCTISHLLYYVNENHPVVAITGEGSAKVILGYDSSNVTIYDPFGNQTYKMSQDEATRAFTTFGNRFFSFVTP